jgi:hypothetical protein
VTELLDASLLLLLLLMLLPLLPAITTTMISLDDVHCCRLSTTHTSSDLIKIKTEKFETNSHNKIVNPSTTHLYKHIHPRQSHQHDAFV